MGRGKREKIDEGYHNWQEVESFLKKVAKDYPDITKLKEVGTSLKGRSIWALKISDNASQKEVEEPVIFFNSMHHAREIATPEIAIDIIKHLTENYGKSQNVRHWVDANEIWIMPMLNVDGNDKVWNEDKNWRKNARGVYGVDINRNYPYKWGSCKGSSGTEWSPMYRGKAAGSEPETQAMMNFVKDIRPVFSISYHSYAQMVLFPYGCKGDRTHTREVVEGIGNKLANLLNYKPGTSWDILYATDGTDIDWFYQQYQVIPYVLEVGHKSLGGFFPDFHKELPGIIKRNKFGWQFLLNRLDGAGVRGQVTNLEQKALAKAHIKVERQNSTNKKFFQNYRVNPDGSYHLVLNPGLYQLTFYSDDKQVVKNVIVAGKRKQLDVTL